MCSYFPDDPEIVGFARAHRLLSNTIACAFYMRVGITDEEIAQENVEVIEDVFSNAILHCWCGWPQNEPMEPNDLLIYVSNRYYWRAILSPSKVIIYKMKVTDEGRPLPETEIRFEFGANEPEYKAVAEIAKKLH